jgi:Leucine-rich repeat (LRR) protein
LHFEAFIFGQFNLIFTLPYHHKVKYIRMDNNMTGAIFNPNLDLEGLRELHLSCVSVKDADLSKCSKLVKLDLFSCLISGDAIDSIATLTNLERLNLSNTHVNYSEKDMSDMFASLKNLKYLSLRAFWILGDKDLENIGGLVLLTELNLTSCNFLTDNCLKYIAKLKNLAILNVTECRNITEEGLTVLKGVMIIR